MSVASDEGTPHTVRARAVETQVPAGYLSKVRHKLERNQIVRSRGGPHGGYTLARPARQISVIEVVNAVDPIRRITSCPLATLSHGRRLCHLHARLDEAIAAIEGTFAQSRASDLPEPGARERFGATPRRTQRLKRGQKK